MGRPKGFERNARWGPDGSKRLYVQIAEKALGKPLPQGACVHHLDPEDHFRGLVICQDNAYHNLLHARTLAFRACGDSHKRPCRFCKQYDDPANMDKYSNTGWHHRWCHNEYEKLRRKGA